MAIKKYINLIQHRYFATPIDAMKALFLILILYVSWTSCGEAPKDYTQQPRKAKHDRIHIINSRRYIKPIVDEVRAVKLKSKQPATGQEAYTVFPHAGPIVGALDVPDSPYFPHDTNFDQKTRVKKVLPDYESLIRKRRSAGIEPLLTPKGNGTLVRTRTAHAKKARNKDEAKPLERKRKKSSKKRKRNKKRHGRVGKRNKTKSFKKLRHGMRVGNKTKAKRSKRNRLNKPPRTVDKAAAPGAGAKDGRRLIAGRDALIEDYPYVVSIQKNDQHWCAGSILNPRLIITTANCLWKSPTTSRLRVRAGSRYSDRGGQVANIAQVMRHPDWGIRKEPDFDVALALLDRKIRFSHSVHGVDLPNRFMIPAFEDAWVASWGSIRRDGIFDSRAVNLQAYYARLLPRPKCNNMTMRFGARVTENFICLSQTGRQSPCTRDTGAPAVSDGVLWGMASWGIRKLCGTERFPAVFSYVGSERNMEFIMNATRYLMVDERFDPFLARLPRLPTATKPPPAPEEPY